jgi:predicted enzyme related to lactoylglutathione lyase
MDLVQGRIVTDDVRRLAAFYASLLDARVTLNDYYVEVPAGPASVGFSRRRFTEYAGGPEPGGKPATVILDFQAADVDAEYLRIDALGVEWVMRPATQPWGSRTMAFRDPEGVLISVFSRESELNAENLLFPARWSCRILVRWNRQLTLSGGRPGPPRDTAGGHAACG